MGAPVLGTIGRQACILGRKEVNQYAEFCYQSGVFDSHVRVAAPRGHQGTASAYASGCSPTWKYLGPLHDLDHLFARQAVQCGEQALRGVRLGAVIAGIHDLGLNALQDHGRGWREGTRDGGELRDQRRVHGWLLGRSNIRGPLFRALWRRWRGLLWLLLVKAF